MSKLTITTRSGSAYEVDLDAKQCRRLSGENPPTERQGPDGEWRTYKFMTVPQVGRSLWFEWDRTGETDPMLRPSTQTSPVLTIAAS